MLPIQMMIAVVWLLGVAAGIGDGKAETDSLSLIVSGDQFILSSGDEVKLLGVTAPRSKLLNRSLDYYSEESRYYLEKLLKGRRLSVQYAPVDSGDRGCVECYVWIDDSVLVNLEMIKAGCARADLQSHHEMEEAFLQAELRARKAGWGMWGTPRGPVVGKAMPFPHRVESKFSVQKSDFVYVSAEDSTFHRPKCVLLGSDPDSLSRDDAVARGYWPCEICRP